MGQRLVFACLRDSGGVIEPLFQARALTKAGSLEEAILVRLLLAAPELLHGARPVSVYEAPELLVVSHVVGDSNRWPEAESTQAHAHENGN